LLAPNEIEEHFQTARREGLIILRNRSQCRAGPPRKRVVVVAGDTEIATWLDSNVDAVGVRRSQDSDRETVVGAEHGVGWESAVFELSFRHLKPNLFKPPTNGEFRSNDNRLESESLHRRNICLLALHGVLINSRHLNKTWRFAGSAEIVNDKGDTSSVVRADIRRAVADAAVKKDNRDIASQLPYPTPVRGLPERRNDRA